MELRSRPFMYANTSQLDLDSFLLYTTSIRMEVSWFNYCMVMLYTYIKYGLVKDYAHGIFGHIFVLRLLPKCSYNPGSPNWSKVVTLYS